jgi:hypothetical protein
MANPNVPLMSQKARTPITSVGSGNARLQDTRNLYNPSGSGLDNAAMGALIGAMVNNTVNTGGGGGVPTGGGAPSGGGLPAGTATPAGNTSNPGGQNTYGGSPTLPTGNIGSTVSKSYPAGTSQIAIDAVEGKSNGKSKYVISGVNPTDGSVIATPNYDIGGTNLTGVGAGPTATATPPQDQTAGTYFQDSYGNIYDGGGNLYAVNNGGVYYVNNGNDSFTNANTYETVTSNQLYGNTGGGYDPSTDYYDTEDYFAQPDNSIQDFYDTEDYFAQADGDYKKGGLATPLMAHGGSVPHFEEGGTTNDTGILQSIQDLLSGTNVKGALLGTLISQLMSGSSNRNVYKGLDMSQVGNIKPVTTDFGMGPANYVPYSDYSEPNNSSLISPAQVGQLNANLGVSGFNPYITPLGQRPVGKANGGRIPTHYTFGTQVNAEDFLAEGGMPHNTNVPMTGGLSSNSNVPMLQGRHDYRNGAAVNGKGDGQSDEIPAMLADGEYVIDADVVASLGNGSNKAGADVLDKFRENIRTHKRSAPIGKIPPKAKSPLAYLKGAK